MKDGSLVSKFRDRIVRQKRTRFDLFLSFGCLILSLAILLSSLTYSWIRRNWSSTITESQLKIEANGSLAFQLDSNKAEYTTSISLLTQIGDPKFTLKPVSNLTGQSSDFFYLDKEVAGGETYAHVTMADTPAGRLETGKQRGYVEFYFKILGESVTEGSEVTTTKFVYLDSNSDFGAYNNESTDAVYSLRISITAKDKTGRETTILFMKPYNSSLIHTGINNTIVDSAYIADGAQYWDGDGLPAQYIIKNGTQLSDGADPYEVVMSANAHQLSEYFGGVTTDENGKRYIDEDQCLCRFSSNESEDIVVRIWIEGTDRFCTDAIAGNKLSLLLSFAAANCEKDPVTNRYYIVEHTA